MFTLFEAFLFLHQDNLLLFHHTRLVNEGTPGVERGYLVGLMFSHFDSNNNGVLDTDELMQVSYWKSNTCNIIPYTLPLHFYLYTIIENNC